MVSNVVREKRCTAGAEAVIGAGVGGHAGALDLSVCERGVGRVESFVAVGKGEVCVTVFIHHCLARATRI